MYISWAAFYEGRTDAAYFNVLLPRLLEKILREEGLRPYDLSSVPAIEFGQGGRSFEIVAQELCRRVNEFHIVFIHSDLGGRGLSASLYCRREALIDKAKELCCFDPNVAIFLSPKKELEAWALCDLDAIRESFGVSRLCIDDLEFVPSEVERIRDPKFILKEIHRRVGRRTVGTKDILVRIAQEQEISRLRMLSSFLEFERSLKSALRHLGCLAAC